MLIHVIAHSGYTNTITESALKVDLREKNPLSYLGIHPVSILCQVFQSGALPTLIELFCFFPAILS